MPNYAGDPGELWRAIGHALWSLQTFEYGLAHLLVLARKPAITGDQAFEELEKGFRKTLGQLVRMLKDRVQVSEEIENRLTALGQERNWLAHHIRRLHEHDIYSAEKFGALLHRLHRLEREALSMANAVQDLSWKWCEARGISRKELEEEAQRILEKRNET